MIRTKLQYIYNKTETNPTLQFIIKIFNNSMLYNNSYTTYKLYVTNL